MLLVPIALEDRAVRSIPWVTLCLIAANVLVLVVAAAAGAARRSDAELLHSLIEKSLEERPYLTIDGRLAIALGEKRASQLGEERALREARAELPGEGQLRREQKEFDGLVEEYLAATDRLPWRRFGFVPAHPRLVSLLTSMFMHAGWLHLLGNMLFLYVGGPHIEEAFGRTLYLASYLLSGVAAALGHAASSPQSPVPLVGASGAIAGVMGILLVRLGGAKIRFLLLPIVFLPNIRVLVSVPAFVVLPFWLLTQLWYAQRTPSQGVAWWAHIVGFGFGCALAALVGLLRIEERWLGRSASVDEGRRALDGAEEARRAGDLGKAHEKLRRALGAEPESVDAWRAAYELALDEADAPELTKAMTRLIDLLARRGETRAALSLVDDPRWAQVPDLPPRLYLSLAAFLERQGDARRALEYYGATIEAAPADVLSLRALTRRSEILIRQGDREEARRSLARAQTHPAFNETWRATIEAALARLEDPGSGRPSTRPRGPA